jgi:hypothetical protein
LPRYLSRDLLRDGVLSGNLALVETLRNPTFKGEAQLANGRPGNLPVKASGLSARLSWNGQKTLVDSLKITAKDADVTLHGDIDFQEPDVMITLSSDRPIFDVTPAQDFNCITDITMVPATGSPSPRRPVQELSFVGNLASGPWSLLLAQTVAEEPNGVHAPSQIRPVMFCADTKGERHSLVLAVEPLKPPPRRKTKQR